MIELKHVTKKYGTVTALEDVSFRVEKGQTVGLLGRNGAGKTTALNVLTGYFPPAAGDVLLDGMSACGSTRGNASGASDICRSGRRCMTK